MEMTVSDVESDIKMVKLAGRLDTIGVDEVEGDFINLMESLDDHVLLDMSDVEFIMSSGLTMLTNGARELKKHNSKLVLINPQELVADVLHNIAIDRITPIAPDLEEARKMVGLL